MMDARNRVAAPGNVTTKVLPISLNAGAGQLASAMATTIATALSEEHGPQSLYYGLTAQGVARWEVQARPDWSRFPDESFGYDPNAGEAIACDGSLLDVWLARQRDLGSATPLSGSEIWETLTPWRATYWKTLPCGYRVRFRWVEHMEKSEWPGLEST